MVEKRVKGGKEVTRVKFLFHIDLSFFGHMCVFVTVMTTRIKTTVTSRN